MIRFANPGSDIDSFIRIYCELFDALKKYYDFDLDDISNALVERNLVTSSGYMGRKALERSTRKDRSRDPIYNQSKMYTELYKLLGWLQPLEGRALRFRFTYLGAHVVASPHNKEALFCESILGITYPSENLDTKGDYVLRPFATIMLTIEELGGLIHRDEMITGPLCISNDRDHQVFESMIHELRQVRGDWMQLQQKMQDLSKSRRILQNTMKNYTRFPVAVLKWTGWTQSQRRKGIYNDSKPFLILTEKGQAIVEMLKQHRDVRATDIGKANRETQLAVSRVGFYSMLERSGFDVYPLSDQISQEQVKVTHFFQDDNSPILFSPYQEMPAKFLNSLIPDSKEIHVENIEEIENNFLTLGEPDSKYVRKPVALSSKVSMSQHLASSQQKVDPKLLLMFQSAISKTGNLEKAVERLAQDFRNSNQSEFYPLIANLFRALGYDCEHSRAGVNYQRWDAFIIDQIDSIPIEIKSPGEEEFLSVKAIRQALENKVILLARKAFPTQRHTTSLAVGYNLPNDRSEVISLISDIYQAYDIVIGVIDFHSLLRLVGATIIEGKQHDKPQLTFLHGIINVSNS